jgi:hypothetical protein
VAGSGDPIVFFMHIMKTAGTSFARHVEANFPAEQIYPDVGGPRHQEQYWKVEELRALPERRRREIRMYHGHFPFVIRDLVGASRTLTLLRDPVERTISHVRHCRRHFPRHAGRSLEEVYDDAWHNPTLFRDYQVKQFAFTADDDPKGHIDVLAIDEERFRTAVDHLEQVTVLGLTHRYPEFTEAVERHLGWRLRSPRRLQVAPDEDPVPDSLRRRIVADSTADIHFYEHARSLYERRRRL